MLNVTVHVTTRRRARTPGSSAQRPSPGRCPRGGPGAARYVSQGRPSAATRPARQLDRQASPPGGRRTAPAALGHGTDGLGARMWPGGGGGLDPRKTGRRSREARGQRARPGSSALGTPPNRTVQLSRPAGRPPNVRAAKAAHPCCSAGLGGRGSQGRGAANGAHHGRHREAAASTRPRLPGDAAPPGETHRLPASPAVRHAAPGARAPGGGACAGGRGLRRADGRLVQRGLASAGGRGSARRVPEVRVVSRKWPAPCICHRQFCSVWLSESYKVLMTLRITVSLCF